MPHVAAAVAAARALPAARRRARDGGGLTGSVFYDVEVPDFTKQKFAHERRRADRRHRAGHADGPGRPGAQGLLPGPPTTGASSTNIDTLALYAEVYDTIGGSTPHTVDITTHRDQRRGKEMTKDDGSPEQQGARRAAGAASATRRSFR